MRINLPANVRAILYVIIGLGTPVVSVLTTPEVHILPAWVMLIWAGEVAFVGVMAALNVTNPTEEK